MSRPGTVLPRWPLMLRSAAALLTIVAAYEDVIAAPDDLDRELRLGLEFQAAGTRMVGGLASYEAMVRLVALEQEVIRGRGRRSADCSR